MFKCRKLIPWGTITLTQSMLFSMLFIIFLNMMQLYLIFSLLENVYVACLQRNSTKEEARVVQQYRPAQKETVSTQMAEINLPSFMTIELFATFKTRMLN